MHGNTVWTPERRKDVIERLCANVATGVSLTRSLQTLDDMPDPRTFWSWMAEDENDEIGQKVARAREVGVEVHLEEALDIADEEPETYSTENGERIDPGDIAHRKNRIETRIKRAQMIAPRKYGAKLDLTSGGDKLPSTDAGDVATRVAGLLTTARERKEQGNGG